MTLTGQRPHVAEHGRQDLPSLTGLRWVAALLVFGIHFTGMALTTPPGRPG